MKTEPFLASSASVLLKKLEPYNPNKKKIPRSTSPSIKRTPTPEKDELQKLIGSLLLIRGIDKIQDKDPEYYDQAEQLQVEVLDNVKDIVYEFNDLLDEIGTDRFVDNLLKWERFSHLTHYLPFEFDWRAKEIKKGRGMYNMTKKMRSFDDLKSLYIDLPYYLRPCFAYCSIYPKGQKIVREGLINLWMAEGLLWSSSSSYEDLEDVGNRYFDELLWKGLFKVSAFAFGSNQEEELEEQVVYSCEMTDDMHALAKEIAGKEVLNMFGNNKKYKFSIEGLESTRRLALNKDALLEDDFFKGHCNEHRVRTCVFFGLKPQIGDVFLEEITWRFERLLVLDLSGTQFKELPRSTRRLKHLRYLSLSRNTILEALPYRLYELKYLQTLALDDCHQLKELPIHTGDLTRMRNLYLTSKDTILSEGILSRWTSLRILELSHCNWLTSLSEEGVKSLLNLRKLRIFDCPRLVSLPDNMKYLTQMEELVLHKCPQLDLTRGEAMEGLSSLRNLEIIGLSKLVRLPKGLESASALRNFLIMNCKSLRDLGGVSFSYLTSLRRLFLYDCPNVVTLPEGLAINLQHVDIRGCPKLSKKFENKEEWRVMSHVHEIIFDGQCLQHKSRLNAESEASSSTHEAPKALILPRRMPFFNLKLQTLGILMVEDNEDRNIQDDTSQEPQIGGCNNSSIRSRARDIISRMKDSILTIYYKDKLSKSCEVESPTSLPPTSHSTSQDLVEARLLCSLFPKDHEFDRDTLIQLWMAGGYLKDEPMEDQGEQFFNTLLTEECIVVSRVDTLTGTPKYKSNIDDAKINYDAMNSSIKTSYTKVGDYKMFDNISKDCLHLALVGDDIRGKTFEEIKKLSNLRSLLSLHEYGSRVKEIPFDLFQGLTCLQILDLSKNHISVLPSSIGNVKELQYLDLSETRIRSLPGTIDRLKKLQTLKLKGCVHLLELPKGITKLTNLRHLEYDVLGQLSTMPRGIGALIALRTLAAFILDNNGKESCSNIEELRLLNNLSGSFCISRLELVKDPTDAMKAALRDKTRLKQIELRWSDIVQEWTHNETEVLENLRPSTCLEQLHILCFPGISFPTWVGHPSFRNLSSITLLKCKNVFLPPLGKLPTLKSLEIIELNNVAKIDREFCGGSMEDYVAFPKLEKLLVDGMFILESWEGVDDGDFPYLSELSVKFCPNLCTLPMLSKLPPLTYLELSNCTSLDSFPDGRCLTSLETLLIEECPLIEIRCSSKEAQHYMDKVKHVQYLWIDGLEAIMGSNEEEIKDKNLDNKEMCIRLYDEKHFSDLQNCQQPSKSMNTTEEFLLNDAPSLQG